MDWMNNLEWNQWLVVLILAGLYVVAGYFTITRMRDEGSLESKYFLLFILQVVWCIATAVGLVVGFLQGLHILWNLNG